MLVSDVLVWRAALDVDDVCLHALTASLTEDEHLRAARFHFERDRRYWIAARGLLRAALGRILKVSPESLRFDLGPWGKPFLQGHSLRFNLSHTNSLMLMAFAWEREVGVDVEYWRDDFSPMSLAPQVFSASEQHFLATLPPEEQHRAFLTLWTGKEAYVKANGQGLSFPLTQLTLRPSRMGRAWSVQDETVQDETLDTHLPSLNVYSLTTEPGSLAALAVEESGSLSTTKIKNRIKIQETEFRL